jgi:hypothetical protein
VPAIVDLGEDRTFQFSQHRISSPLVQDN